MSSQLITLAVVQSSFFACHAMPAIPLSVMMSKKNDSEKMSQTYRFNYHFTSLGEVWEVGA
jgi:hypothetical protein